MNQFVFNFHSDLLTVEVTVTWAVGINIHKVYARRPEPLGIIFISSFVLA